MPWKSKREPSGGKIKLNVKPVLTQDTEDWGQGGRERLLSGTRNAKNESKVNVIHRNNLFLPHYSSEDIHVDLKQRAKDRGVLIEHEQPTLLL